MTEYSKYNVIYRLQKWLDSVPGQTFMNYAYSWGAAVVILGTLFKLTHLPGANIALFLGMGTEVFVFLISAFDRPFDKTADGKELPTHVNAEEVEEEYEEDMAEREAEESGHTAAQPGVAGVQGGGTIIIGGAASNGGGVSQSTDAANTQQGIVAIDTGATVSVQAAAQMAAGQETAAQLADAQAAYLEQLKNLTETLQKVSEQSVRLTRDSEEMENLNRTLTGICKVYEMQLKGASQQIGTIDQINDQSRKMAQQIEQLNSIYARMIEAMTVNMNLKVKE